MIADSAKILLMGFGNPGRVDDGLGPALATAVENLRIPGVTVDCDYQLMLEDAAEAAKHDVVVYADADTKGTGLYSFRRLHPVSSMSFSTHSLRPAAVLGLAHQLFGSTVKGYMLGIRGFEFNEYREALSPKAQESLAAAIEFIEPVLRTASFDEAAARWPDVCEADKNTDKVLRPVNEVEICKMEKR